MPSGYTAKLLNEGQTFEEFVWTCARAMGSYVMMREDPLSAPIPKRFEYDTYYKESLAKSELEYATLSVMNKDEQRRFGVKRKREYSESFQRGLVSGKNRCEGVERYKAMLKRVQEWTPPTSEHDNFKKFMLEQLEQSIEFDDHTDYYAKESKKIDNTTPEEHYQEALDLCKRSIGYYTEHWRDEVKRTNDRNEWIAQLHKSVPIPEAMAG